MKTLLTKKYSNIILVSALSIFLGTLFMIGFSETFWKLTLMDISYDKIIVIKSISILILNFLIGYSYTKKIYQSFLLRDAIIAAILSLLISIFIPYTKNSYLLIAEFFGLILGIITALKYNRLNIKILLIISNIIGLILFFGVGYLVFISVGSSFCMHPLCGILQFMGFLVTLLPMILSFYAWHYYSRESLTISRLGFIFIILPYVMPLFLVWLAFNIK